MRELAIGMFGGTFDPVHNAHLQLAHAALAALPVAEIRLIPAARPPHREPPQASDRHRLAMLQAALQGEEKLRADDRELQRQGPSWTVDTLRSLRADYGAERSLILLLGSDALASLAGWREWQCLPELAHLVVFSRPGHALTAPAGLAVTRLHRAEQLLDAPAGGLLPLVHAETPLSATAVRAALRAGKLPSDWLPAEVLAYIETHSLYGCPAQEHNPVP